MLSFLKQTARFAVVIPVAALLFAACDSDDDGPEVPSLGSASTYGVLAGTAISCVTAGTISADIGLSPGVASSITGFPPCTRTGTTNAGNPAAAAAQLALTAAYNDLAGLACGETISADLGGRTLAPGVYCSGSALNLTGALTLSGSGTYVFQAGSALTLASGASVVLAGGAQARNVYWQVGSSATLGTSTAMKGNVVALTSITLGTTANLIGRALARNGSVSLGGTNNITLP